MISDDGDIHDFPPWVWPYIREIRADRINPTTPGLFSSPYVIRYARG